MSSAVERFLRYAKIDTQSDRSSSTCPSTAKQFDLARLLVDELHQLGLQEVSLDENGYVMAALPGNIDGEAPVIGFIAHIDTSPDMSGAGVNPRLIENYDGGDILLNAEQGVVLSPREFPDVKKYVGQPLLVTDGTTLLGADDKAGIAAIMAAMEYLIGHPEVKHGTLKVAFNPDEEIGRGAHRFDLDRFGANLAYTVDGGEIGELQYENFNAARALVKVRGRNVHPGSAKDKMINSILIAAEINAMLPAQERPMHTENYEGFYHLESFQGAVEETQMAYIVRDHDAKKFEARKHLLEGAVAYANQKYGDHTASVEILEEYRNMKELIEPVFHVIEVAKQAMLDVGVEPLIIPIRGGTDGAQLTYRGLPTPNLFNGGHYYHGKYEFLPIRSLEKAVEVIVRIAELYAA